MIRLSTMIRLGAGNIGLLGSGAHRAGVGKIRLGPGNIGLLGSGAHRAGVGKIRLGAGLLAGVGPRPCQSAPAETARSPSSGCRTGSWAQISTRCPGKQPPTLPPRRLCHFAPQNSSSSLGMFNNYHQHNKARTGKGAAKQFRMLGPIFF